MTDAEVAVGLYQFYVAEGHSSEDALDRLASVLATALTPKELLEVLDALAEEVNDG